MQKKKILIFHPALAPYRVDQFNFLNDLFNLEVVFLYDNVKGHNFDQNRLVAMLNCKFSYLLHGPRIKSRVFRWGILRTIKRVKPDIIIGYEYSPTTLYLLLLKRLGVITQKIGSTIDDNIHTCNNVQTFGRHLVRKFALQRLDFLVVLSNDVAAFFKEKFFLHSTKIIIFPILQRPERLRMNQENLKNIAIEYSRTYKLAGKKVLLFVGRLVPKKGISIFIDSVHTILKEQENVVFNIVGDGSDRTEIQKKIVTYGLADRVYLLGRHEFQELYAWYVCASGFILPSTFEPFGAVVNEAMVFGLNVLCSKFAGATSLINNETGLIFDPLDIVDTRNKFLNFLKQIKAVDTTVLSLKKPIIDFNEDIFKHEWNKLVF